LHISNIGSSGVSEADLKHHLGHAAPVEEVKVFEHMGKHMALARFSNVEGAVNAMCSLHNSLLSSQHLRLSFTRNRF
jgi:hypothetical protein